MDAKNTLAEYAARVEVELDRYFASLIPQTHKLAPEAVDALLILREYTLRKAKRLRAALIFYTYRMMGGRNLDEALRVSMFIELVQSYLLIHDDVMDQDELRRGKPTVHTIYKRIHKQRKYRQDPSHFGDSQAINVGDIASHLSQQILAESDFPDRNKIKALAKLNSQIMTVGFGQMLDVFGSVQSRTTEDDVMRIHHYKTAVYTYETPMTVAALLAGASEDDLKILSEFAIPAGIAFQIQDDILGMFGDEDKLGKANDSDLREGKHTLLIIKALENSRNVEKQVIKGALGNPNLTDDMADAVREVIISTGSLDYSKELAIKLVKKAKRALEKMPNWNGEGREFLDGIADYMINREF